VLPALKELAITPVLSAAIAELEAIVTGLAAMGISEKLIIDFSVVNDMNYYNGIAFKGFVYGIPVGILSGGEYFETDKLLIGRSAENFLRSFNTDISFLSCDGISEDGYVSIEDENTAEIVRIAFQNSQKRIILADRSKMGNRYTYNVCRTEDADDIIVI
jgi:DeoR/GlpR family transcriptional regulator of sugar metabolism